MPGVVSCGLPKSFLLGDVANCCEVECAPTSAVNSCGEMVLSRKRLNNVSASAFTLGRRPSGAALVPSCTFH